MFISPTVIDEIADGDPDAAAKRVEATRGLPVLPDHPEVRALADKLAAGVPIPEDSQADAAHLAFAAFHKMDYLGTWNQTHLDNPHLRGKIKEVIEGRGLSPAVILTPELLMEMKDD